MNLTKNELALIKAFNREDLIETTHNAFEIFNILAFQAFVENLQGEHVEALRRSYKVWQSPEYTPEKYQEALKIKSNKLIDIFESMEEIPQ